MTFIARLTTTVDVVVSVIDRTERQHQEQSKQENKEDEETNSGCVNRFTSLYFICLGD